MSAWTMQLVKRLWVGDVRKSKYKKKDEGQSIERGEGSEIRAATPLIARIVLLAPWKKGGGGHGVSLALEPGSVNRTMIIRSQRSTIRKKNTKRQKSLFTTWVRQKHPWEPVPRKESVVETEKKKVREIKSQVVVESATFPLGHRGVMADPGQRERHPK